MASVDMVGEAGQLSQQVQQVHTAAALWANSHKIKMDHIPIEQCRCEVYVQLDGQHRLTFSKYI